MDAPYEVDVAFEARKSKQIANDTLRTTAIELAKALEECALYPTRWQIVERANAALTKAREAGLL